MRESSAPSKRIAADVGGTFTDVVCFDESTGQTTFGKQLSTNQQISRGIESGMEEAGSRFGEASLFLHGATVAINTLLERSGARTALVTTRGFRDVYEIGRINRPDAYNLFFRKHVPLVERRLRLEVTERMLHTGAVHTPLDTEGLADLVDVLREEEVQAVAVVFLNSYRNPAHEKQARDFLARELPGVFVTSSHELSREYREYERTSTAAANAYIGPRVQGYLQDLHERATTRGFQGKLFLVQSTGGLFSLEQAKSECIRMLESGPAAGVVGVQAVCRAMGLQQAIAFDMGGTTAKAGVILGGEPLVTRQVMIGGYAEGLPAQVPMIDIQEVGTGGGSIARVEAGGGLRVGPQSAGSRPGPVCYDLGGTEPTVTDANLVLGRLNAKNFLGGSMALNSIRAHEAIAAKLAAPLGMSTEAAAEGVLRIAVSSMANVVRRVTTERGLDVQEFPMFAFGGAGPLHAADVARELRMSKVIIPAAPGHFSAFGMLAADLRRDFVQTLFTKLAALEFDALEREFRAMEDAGRSDLAAAAASIRAVEVVRSLDMRYVGQEHAVTVSIPMAVFERRDKAAIKAAFDAEHLARYAFNVEGEPAEVVSIRASVRGLMEMPKRVAAAGAARASEPNSARSVFMGGRSVEASVFDRTTLAPGTQLRGPALIEEHATTTVLSPSDRAEVDAFGNIVITVGE